MFKPGHYRAVPGVTSRYIAAGQRVRFVSHNPLTDEVSYVRGDQSYTTPAHVFRAQFTHLPDGDAAYQQELLALQTDMSVLVEELTSLELDLSGSRLALNTSSGEVSGVQALMASVQPDEQDEQPPVTDQATRSEIIQARSTTRLQQARTSILTIEQRATQAQGLVESKRKEIEKLIAELATAARAKLAPIKAYIAKLTEVVTTLDLYAGSNEQLYTITSGQPAPEQVPVTLRQGVLSMAEEAAVMLHDEGLDARNVDQFVAWVAENPARIDTFLPEQKGLVALVPTWQTRDYGNSFVNSRMADANTQTYLLIRNGENIYLVVTNFQAGGTLTPDRRELNAMFSSENGQTFEPGSAAFLKAEQAAEGIRRHYYKVALLLQGLVDRTALLQPLPQDADGVRRVSMTGAEDYQAGRVVLIEDVSMALQDQRETFREWQRRINKGMDVGKRAFGHWRGKTFVEGYTSTSERVRPKGAYLPDSGEVLTIEEYVGRQFVARYHRTESWMDQNSPRASIRLQADDEDVLLFDHPDVTPEAIEDFLGRREERKNYLTLVPLLRGVREAKRREMAEEAPFLRLLTELGEREYGFSAHESALNAAETIAAYKQGRKLHTPLPVSDVEAFRKCAELLGKRGELRAERALLREQGVFGKVVDELRRIWPGVMLISHLRGNEYAAVIPHREDESKFARIVFYRYAGRGKSQTLKVTEEREWRTLTGIWRRHEALYASPRWATWEMYASTAHAFTDEETEALCRQVVEQEPPIRSGRDDSLNGALLGITVLHNPLRFVVYRDNPNYTHWRIRAVLYRPDRTADGLTLRCADATYVHFPKPGSPVWSGDEENPFRSFSRQEGPNRQRVLVEYVPALRVLEEVLKEKEVQRKEGNQQHTQAWELTAQYREAYEAQWWEQAHAKFLRDYGEESAYLWEGQKKAIANTMKVPHEIFRSALYDSIRILMEADLPLGGLSAGEIVDCASERGRTFSLPKELRELKLTH